MQKTEHPRPQDSESVRPDALQTGQPLLRGQYTIVKYLSAGGFGITYLATDSLDRKVVIKECFPSAMCVRTHQTVQVRSEAMRKDFATVSRHFQHEALRLAKLSHPNIVGVHQVFEDNNTVYMALDFIDGRDLLTLIENGEKVPPETITKMLLKLLDAIVYIHKNKVLHRDISPDNILVDANMNPVLIDFGAARETASNTTRALSALQIVKDGYSPQEFYLSNDSQTAPSDLYSLAATFYHLITGKAPPNSQVRLAAIAAEEPDPYTPIPPFDSGFDHFFLEAIDKALAVFPKNRHQTADEWIEMIDTPRRQAAMRERARRDKQVDLTIKQMTEETNRAIALESKSEAKRAAREAKVEARAQQASPAALPRAEMSNGETEELFLTEDALTDPVPRRRSLLSMIMSVPVAFFRKPNRPAQNRRAS